MKKTIALLFLLFVSMTCESAFANLTGPVFPAPGGNNYTKTGNSIGDQGGVTFSYNSFNPSAYSSLYWGPSSSIVVSLNNNNNDTIGSLQSSSAGLAIGTGSSTIYLANGTQQTVQTQFDLYVTDLNHVAVNYNSLLGLFDVTSAISTTGGFDATLTAYALNGSTWVALNPYYNGQQTIASNQTKTSFSGGFDYSAPASPTPIPAAVYLLGSGLMGLFGFKKRKA
jgi:hypothetical protein